MLLHLLRLQCDTNINFRYSTLIHLYINLTGHWLQMRYRVGDTLQCCCCHFFQVPLRLHVCGVWFISKTRKRKTMTIMIVVYNYQLLNITRLRSIFLCPYIHTYIHIITIIILGLFLLLLFLFFFFCYYHSRASYLICVKQLSLCFFCCCFYCYFTVVIGLLFFFCELLTRINKNKATLSTLFTVKYS